MPLYRYKAVNTSGDVAAGELDAANESEIVDRLRDQGLMPMQVVAAAGERVAAAQKVARHSWFAPRRVTRDHLLAFTRELATLLRAGLPLDRALEVLINLTGAPPVARLLQAVRDSVRGGKSLSQALDMHREVFSRFYVNIVRAGGWLFRRWLRRPAARFRWDQRLLRWPLIGDLTAKIEVARFARTLATLLGNGVTLLAGLSIVKETMTNSVLAQALDGVTSRLREGKGFGRPLLETGLYPRLATQMILVGEESGRLEEMLNRVADVYDREVAMAVKRFLAVLEPALILGLAVLIGGIVFSILLGVMGMSELVV